jgi:BCD family chlorophyll transporter-like MFS transporter
MSVGAVLEPYSPERLLAIVAVVTGGAFTLTCLAVWGVERRVEAERAPEAQPFLTGLREVWAEREARVFTFFVFLSMTAFFMQELILEPYAGLVFGFSPGQSTALSGAQNGGVFLGMITVGIAGTALRLMSLRTGVVLGCLGSAAALAVIAALGPLGPGAPLVPAVVAMGFFNGMFAVAAIGTMMARAGAGREAREGTRMGLWGAAQAIAAGFGGLAGAAAADVLRAYFADAPAFGAVFLAEAALFVAAAAMAFRMMQNPRAAEGPALVPGE